MIIAPPVQSIPACARLRLCPALSARVCSWTLELETPGLSIQSRSLQRQHSISRPGARTGFPEGTGVETPSSACIFILFFIYAGPVRYYSANWDVAEVERDWKDAILEQKALVNRLGVPRL